MVRIATASLVDWWPTRTTSGPDVKASLGPSTATNDLGTKLDVEATFCYLSDKLCSGGGCDTAITARCFAALGKFRKLLLSSPPGTPLLKCVGRCTRPVYAPLCSTVGKRGVRTPWPRHDPLDMWHQIQRWYIFRLHQKLDIKEITAVLCSGWLRWYGHVQLATSYIKSITDPTLPGPRGKGRPRKTWSECVKIDISACSLPGKPDLQNREAWRASVQRSLLLPTPLDGTRISPLSRNGYDDDENSFTISKNKTVAMHFSPDKKCMDLVLILENDPIKFVKETKLLGLIWDTKLTFEPRIKCLKAWCQKSLNNPKILSHTEWGADQTTLLK